MTERAQILIRAKDETAGAFSSVQGHFKGMSDTLRTLAPQIAAALSVGGVIAFAKSAIDAGDRMNDLSQKTGLSVESLSKWKFVAEQSNATLESIQPGLKGLAQNMESAARGSKESADAFARLGVPVKDGAGNLRQMDQVMLDLAGKFSTMPEGAQKTALAVRIFGKAGQEMIPILNQGSSGIGELMAMAEKLGLVMSTEAAAAADELNDSLNLMKQSVTSLSTELINQAAPAISQVARAMADAARDGGFFAAAMAGYSEAWKSWLGGTGSDQLRQQRLLVSGLQQEVEMLEKGIEMRKKSASIIGPDLDEMQRKLDAAILSRRSALEVLERLEEQEKKANTPIKTGGAVVTPAGPLGEDLEKRRRAAEALSKELRALTNEDDERFQKDRDNTMESMRLHQIADRQRSESLASLMAESDALFVKDQGQTIAKNEQLAQQELTRLDSLRTSLMTEDELRKFAYEEDFNLLNNTLGMKKEAQEEYYTLMGRLIQKNTKAQIAIEEKKNNDVRNSQMRTWQFTAGLLASLPGQSKAVAIAIIAINKGLAIAQVTQSTAVAVMRALAELGPIAGPPAVATIKTLGAFQIGLIAATGLIEAGSVGGGAGATPTFDVNPSTGIPTGGGFEAPPSPIAQPAPVQRREITINFIGSGRYSQEEIRDSLIPALNEALGDGLTLRVN
jgi:hypothetical protein